MDSNLRWVAVAFVLGLCAAYALWGGASAVPRNESKAATDMPTVPVKSDDTPKVPLPFTYDPPAVDFGDVQVGETKTQLVSVTNVTAKTVKIVDCKHSCGCMKTEILAGDIAPGQSGAIKLTFTGLPGKRLTDYSIEPIAEETLPSCPFKVHAKVIQVFETDPESLNFGRLKRGESKTISATVTRVDGTPFNIKAWAFDKLAHKEFKAQWSVLAGSNGSAYRVEVTATGISGTMIRDRLNLVTDRTLSSSVPFIVHLEVESDVKCADQRLAFAFDQNKVLQPVDTTIHLDKPGTLEVDKIEDDQGGSVKFEAIHLDPATIRLTIHLSEESKTRQPWGELLVKTKPIDDLLRIPYVIPRTHSSPQISAQTSPQSR